MKNVFRFLIILLFLQVPQNTCAQFSLKLSLVSPTGYLGVALKKTPSLSIGKINSFSGRTRFRMHGELAYFKPKTDPFNIYAISTTGNKDVIYPGYQKIKLFMNLYYTFGLDYSLINRKKMCLYTGFDLMAGMTLSKYQENIPNLVSRTSFDGIPFIGLKGRAGIEYKFEKCNLFFEMNRSYYLNADAYILNYNDYGIGIRF